jgi:lipopolysaccharide transport system ATP-binding protein
MTKAEIRRKFDEIVDFAEVEQFIDTPVKRYSSGMYVRLAFAVAAHLEPQILIVDEVLAVGDVNFQTKCLGKMERIASNEGRTILFVSHNMQAVARLCNRALLIEGGKLHLSGDTHTIIDEYLKVGQHSNSQRRWPESATRPGNDIVRLQSVGICSDDGSAVTISDIKSSLYLEMEYEVLEGGHALVPNYHVFNEEGVCIFVVQDLDPAWRGRPKPPGRYVTTTQIPGNFLAEGRLIIGAALSSYDPLRVHFYEREVVSVQIVDSLDGASARGDFKGHYPGVVRPILESHTVEIGRPSTGAPSRPTMAAAVV